MSDDLGIHEDILNETRASLTSLIRRVRCGRPSSAFFPSNLARLIYMCALEQKDQAEVLPKSLIFTYALAAHLLQTQQSWIHQLETCEQQPCLEELTHLKTAIEQLAQPVTPSEH
jgi:hypothetical protein